MATLKIRSGESVGAMGSGPALGDTAPGAPGATSGRGDAARQTSGQALVPWSAAASRPRGAAGGLAWLKAAARVTAQALGSLVEQRSRPTRGVATGRELETLTGLAYLGAIPKAQSGLSERNPSLAVVERDDLPLTVAFRNTHASLVGACPAAKVIALSSALPGDGKTTCALAMARQSALRGHRTVLIDCDLRRRSASAALDRPPAAGLLELLAGEATLDEALHLDGFTPLRILPVVDDTDRIRRAVVGDAFGDPATAQLMSLMRARFDYVFLDAPPALGIADTRRLAPLADAILFVSRWRGTPRNAVQRAVDLLQSTGTPLAGAVLTRAPPALQGAPLTARMAPLGAQP